CEALPPAVLAQVPESLGEALRGARAGYEDLPACEGDPSRGPGLKSEQCSHQLTPPRAHQPGDAKHLAAAQLEAGLRQERWGGDVVHREHHVALIAFPSPERRGGARVRAARPTMCAISRSLLASAMVPLST